jgi:hypothetical protein
MNWDCQNYFEIIGNNLYISAQVSACVLENTENASGGTMNRQELLDTIRFRSDGTVWSNVHVNPVIYEPFKGGFDSLASQCPHVNFQPGYWHTKEPRVWKDPWGYVWNHPGDWLDGIVVEHPIRDWAAFDAFRAPDPSQYPDLIRLARQARGLRETDKLVSMNVEHGFFFLKLTYVRGFEALMFDMADQVPELDSLCSMISDYWMAVMERAVVHGLDIVYFGDDLGAQTSLPISPAAWRRYVKPFYKRIFSFLREKGVEVFLHTDGWILDIIPDLVETGVTLLNPQDTVNGLGNLARLAKGKVAIELDIDRQHITFSGTDAQIDSHIRSCVETLGSAGGGLFLTFGGYPGTPAGNVMSVMRAMEKHHGYWSQTAR